MTEPLPNTKTRFIVLAVVSFFLLIADQTTKFLAVRNLTPAIQEGIRQGRVQPGFASEMSYFYREVRQPCSRVLCDEHTVINGFWTFHYRENRGAAWSLLAGVSDAVRVPFFVLTTVLALGFILHYFRRTPSTKKILLTSLTLIFAGAIGNLVDRLYLGYVIDFIHWFVGEYTWPTFNVADSAITVGATLLVIDVMFSKQKEPAKELKRAEST
ncbi:MAG: signal peptidase II [Myxococcota bacterium]